MTIKITKRITLKIFCFNLKEKKFMQHLYSIFDYQTVAIIKKIKPYYV